MQGLRRGRLRIAAVTTAEHFMPDLLGSFARQYLGWAMMHQESHRYASLSLGIAAFASSRGCPMCWTVSLFETIAARRRKSSMTKVETHD